MSSKTNLNDPQEDWGPLSGLSGNPIMWILIASELLVFGAIFISFGFARLAEPQIFAEAQDHLNRFAGAVNTMVLLTSGLFAAIAVHFQSRDETTKVRFAIAGAIVLGVVFLGVKFIEYADKFEQGISTETNTFFMFYYLATAFHAMHVVFGIVLLLIVGWKNSMENIVTGTAFWHMVDLIWVILFPLIYLMR